MKTTLSKTHSAVLAMTGFLLQTAGIFATDALPAVESQVTTKTHTLFMGADISVGEGEKLYPVKSVAGSSWVVEANDKTEVITSKDGPINIKFTPTLKLTEVSAVVTDFKSERGYTFDNDPLTRQTRALTNAADVYAGNQVAVNQATAVNSGAIAASEMGVNKIPGSQGAVESGGNSPANYIAAGAALVRAEVEASAQAAAAASNGPGSDLFFKDSSAQSRGFDALDLSFKISSERPLNNPYVVTVTRFHPNGSSQVQKMIYAKELNPIDARVQIIHLIEGGFPPNFEALDSQIHLYNRGEEIATSISLNRARLTRDEAFEYVKMEYIAAHKGDTMPATPAMGKLPADLPAALASGKYRDTMYAMVSKDGLANAIFSDAECSRKIEDPYLVSVITGIRFKPALNKGKPVEGIASLRLSDLVL